MHNHVIEATSSQVQLYSAQNIVVPFHLLLYHILALASKSFVMNFMDEVNTFTPGRTVDIDLGTAEVITIDLDNLDPNPDDVLDLLKDGQCKDWVWTKLAGEYWRKGYLEGAERIALTAVDCKSLSRCASATNPLCSFSIKRIDCLASFYLLSSGQSYDRSVEASSQTYTC